MGMPVIDRSRCEPMSATTQHTIDEDTDEQFETAGDAVVSIRKIDEDGNMTVELIPKGEGELEVWEWSHDTVVVHLVNGNLIPKSGSAVDYLHA